MKAKQLLNELPNLQEHIELCAKELIHTSPKYLFTFLHEESKPDSTRPQEAQVTTTTTVELGDFETRSEHPMLAPEVQNDSFTILVS